MFKLFYNDYDYFIMTIPFANEDSEMFLRTT